jgi:hypothetical protein
LVLVPTLKLFFFKKRTPFIRNLENNQFAYGFEVSETKLRICDSYVGLEADLAKYYQK